MSKNVCEGNLAGVLPTLKAAAYAKASADRSARQAGVVKTALAPGAQLPSHCGANKGAAG